MGEIINIPPSGGGSGGGFKLDVVDSVEITTPTNVNNGSYTDTGLDLAFTTDGTETVFLCTQGMIVCTANGAHNAYIRALIDGATSMVLTVVGSNVSTDYLNFTLFVPLVGLSAGAHTLKIQAATTANFKFQDSATDGRCKAFILQNVAV